MEKRSLAAVVILPFVTFGIYAIYWFVKTKGELNNKGAEIPTAWLLIVPFVNIYWLWKYFEGAEKVTNGKANAILNFLLQIFVTPIISMAICQDAYNKLEVQPVAAAAVPQQPPVIESSSQPPAPVA